MPNFNNLVFLWIGIAVCTFLLLTVFKIKAPYGRHASTSWGKMMPNNWGWFWMELPALVILPVLVLVATVALNGYTILLTSLWVLHYFFRTIIFPFRLRTSGKQIPVLIVGSGFCFNLVNGFLNGYFLGFLMPEQSFAITANIIIGVILFFAGMHINRMADRKLIALRKKHTAYQIPEGWLFKYISCPNYFGEIIEWIGFSIIAWNLPALSFSVWTFCNLVPRALNHHEWYREHFEGYPKERKAVLPFLI